jgi:hypothetical protein
MERLSLVEFWEVACAKALRQDLFRVSLTRLSYNLQKGNWTD